MESVVSLASLEFDEAVAKAASNTDETQISRAVCDFERYCHDRFGEKVKEAAVDVKKIIENKQQHRVKAQE